ncbi:MAG: hypothetical protein AAF443_00860 [Chlamydiota bacterium]
MSSVQNLQPKLPRNAINVSFSRPSFVIIHDGELEKLIKVDDFVQKLLVHISKQDDQVGQLRSQVTLLTQQIEGKDEEIKSKNNTISSMRGRLYNSEEKINILKTKVETLEKVISSVLTASGK